MRPVLALTFLAAFGMASASALPVSGVHGVSAPPSGQIVQVASKNKAAAASRRARSKNNGGVHPLVGSGDY